MGELVVPGLTELSVVNSGDELSISVEKLEVEVPERDQDSQPYWPSSQTPQKDGEADSVEVPLVVSEPVVTGPTELSVVNSGDELSISVEKAEVEWLEPAADWQPYWPSSQTLEDGPAALDVPPVAWLVVPGPAELSVVNSGDELSMVVPGELVTVETQTSGETVMYEVTVTSEGQLAAQLVTVTVEVPYS